MAKNRRNHTHVALAPMFKVLLICIFLGGSAVGYVLQKNKLYELGKAIKEREDILARLRWENKIRADQLAEMQLPQHLAERVRQERLGLVAPSPDRIIWMMEPWVPGGADRAPGLLVLRGERK